MAAQLKLTRFAAPFACIAIAHMGGCGPKPDVEAVATKVAVTGQDAQVERISADPIAFLQETLERTKKLDEFTLTFQRQERLGVFKQLQPLETMRAEHRAEPFSVRFTWLDDDSEYLQCVYVEGQNDGKVVLLPRKGLFGMPPRPEKYPPEFAVTFKKARNPITDFGPRRMIERTLDRIENAREVGGARIVLQDAAEIGPAREPSFHLEMRFPKGDPYACKLQDIYISTRTLLPVAAYLWLPGEPERTRKTLDALYIYSGLNADVHLTDAHFELDGSPGQGAETADAKERTESDKPEEPITAGDRIHGKSSDSGEIDE